MSNAVRARLFLFLVLSVVGVLAVSVQHLGLVDAVLGRGYTVTAELDRSGGLFVGSQVTNRGVEVGEVTRMTPGDHSIEVTLELEEGTRIPTDSPFFVHNGSAVGEQYLDFEPTRDDGPYLAEGDRVTGTGDTLPVDEADLLVDLDQFIRSVDRGALRTVVEELGLAFDDAGPSLRRLLDGGGRLLRAADASKEETISLLRTGRVVLQTQQDRADDLRAFTAGLAQVAGALRTSDGDIRTLLQGGPPALEQVRLLLEGLEPTLPVLLSNLVTINQVTATRLPGIEQLLVTFPAMISSGFAGTTSTGYGHVNLQFTEEPRPCTKGYLPAHRWRNTTVTTDGKPYLKAHCASDPPVNVRGSKHAPGPTEPPSRVAPYDPRTGVLTRGDRLIVLDQRPAVQIYGGDAWRWMLIGPTVPR